MVSRLGSQRFFQAWLGQFAFLDLWAVLPHLLSELQKVLPSGTFPLSAPQLPVCQAYGSATVFAAFDPNGLKFRVNEWVYTLQLLVCLVI